MLFREVLDRFVQESPVSVMVRATLEHTLTAEFLDPLFREHAVRQRESTLLFSTIVDLMTLVAHRHAGLPDCPENGLCAVAGRRRCDFGQCACLGIGSWVGASFGRQTAHDAGASGQHHVGSRGAANRFNGSAAPIARSRC